MNREIKFRYWDNVLKHYFYSDEFNWPTSLEKLSYFFAKAKNYAENVEPYTGLKDKNGKEIYDGDIIHIPSGEMKNGSCIWVPYGHVWYCEIFAQWTVSYNHPYSETSSNLFPIGELSEVVGNIHQHEELFKQS